jgi:hypothetical protein
VIDKLAFTFGLDYATVLGWFCDDYDLSTIKQALRAAASDVYPAEDLDENGIVTDEAFLEKVEEYLLLFAGEDDLDLDDDLDDEKGDEDGDDMDKSDSFYCRADTEKQHPTALRYAVHYAEMVGEEDISAAYDTIMIWFCEDNFGFGEIKHALKTAEKVGGEADPQTYLDRRTGGEGWGDIWQGLQLIGQGKPKLHPVFGANWPNENKNSTQEEGDPVVTGPQGKGKPNKPGK